MQKKICISVFTILFCFFDAYAQSTLLPIGSDDNTLLDRLETKSGKLSDSLCLTFRAEMRNRAVDFILQKKNENSVRLSKIDLYNLNQMLSENGEWSQNEDGAIDSKHPWFNTFYKKQYDMVHVKTKDFFFVFNPVVNLTTTHEQGNAKSVLLLNQHGIEARGRITSKIGFYTLLTDNQETVPSFITNYAVSRRALPGFDYYLSKTSPNNFDYFYASGYINFSAVKDHVDITFGNGKNFIGDGIRSLFISDNSANTTYLKINTRIWKFNYQNLFLELTPQFRNIDQQLAHTYSTIHHLSINATKWLNLGIFETIVFSRPNTYEVDYLNPIIFYRYVERVNGSPDNVLIGFNAKAIAAHHLQFYGQFLLDEFTGKEFFAGKGYWANKWGFQLGGKYFDAFSVKNLDLQGEINAVRPFTYSHSDTVINYSNYNQALAHPLGSGFIEMLGVAKYAPLKNLNITLKGMYYMKGADTGSINYGNDIFTNYISRYANYGVPWISGVKTNCMELGLNVSYQLFRNVYLDIGGAHRRFVSDITKVPISSTTGVSTGNSSTTWYYFGIRWNAARRAYDSYF